MDSQSIITHGLYLTSSIGLIITTIIYFMWEYSSISEFLNITIVNSFESKLIVIFLTVKVFFDMIRGILSSYLFANNLNHFTTYINTFQYTLECILIVGLIYFGYNLIDVSKILILPPIISCLILLNLNYKKFGYRIKLNFSLKYVKMLFKPSYSFSILSISEYILNQGFIIIFKKFYISESLIIFNSAKTLTNYIKQIQALIASSVFPVFNVYFGKNEKLKLNKLYFKSRNITIITTFILSIIFVLLGEFIWNVWLGDSISYDQMLFNIMVFIQLIGSCWIISSNLIVSTNNHFIFSQLYLISSILSIIVFYLFNTSIFISFSIVPIFYLIHHFIMMFYSISNVQPILKITK